MDFQHLLLLLISIFCVLIALPLVTYHGYKYYKNRNHIIYIKRYSHITVYEIIFAIIKYLMNGAVMLILYFENDNNIVWSCIEDIILSISNLCFQCSVLCMTIRFILLSFDMNYIALSQNKKWENIVDNYNNLENTNTDMLWYLNKKAKYGNVKCILIIFAPLFLILFVMDVLDTDSAQYIFDYSNKTYTIIDIIDTITSTIRFIPMFIIYFTFPKFIDNIYISGEVKRIFIAISLWCLSHIIVQLSDGVTYGVINNTWNNVFYTMSVLILFITDLAMILISTYWVNKRVIHLIKPYEINNEKISQAKANSFNYLTINNYNINDNTNTCNNYKAIKIEQTKLSMEILQVLNNKEQFEYFMDHIIKEFLLNELLAFIELIQFEKHVVNLVDDMKQENIDINDNDKKYKLQWYKRVEFNESIVKSSIVYNSESKDVNEYDEMIYSLKQNAYELFVKYIEINSILEIDIDINNRLKIISLMKHKYDGIIDNILHLFDGIIDNIFQLLIYSYQRCQQRTKYEQRKIQSCNSA